MSSLCIHSWSIFFSGYRILGWHFFFLLELSYIVLLSSDHCNFWWKSSIHVSPCSHVSTLPFFFFLALFKTLLFIFGFQNFDHDVLRFILFGVCQIIEIILLYLLPFMRDFWPSHLPVFPPEYSFSSLVPGFQLHILVFLLFCYRCLRLCSLF